MPRIVRSPQAKRDIIQIWVSIAQDNTEAADRLISVFNEKLRLLADWPNAGQARPELAPRLRSYPVGNYLLFYRAKKGGIELSAFSTDVATSPPSSSAGAVDVLICCGPHVVIDTTGAARTVWSSTSK
jgi:toxin ParE1/3/4